jgi:hypothetical protein
MLPPPRPAPGAPMRPRPLPGLILMQSSFVIALILGSAAALVSCEHADQPRHRLHIRPVVR